MVVRGSNGGKNITRTIVSNNLKDSTPINILFVEEELSHEHHNDPHLLLQLPVQVCFKGLKGVTNSGDFVVARQQTIDEDMVKPL